MKRLLMIRCAILALMLFIGKSTCFADTYSYTFTSAQFDSNETVDLGGVSWTLSGKGGDYWACTNETKGHQFGSGSYPYTSMSLSTSDIKGTITQIIINTSGASDTNAKLQVKVGGNAFGSQVSLTSEAKTYTFEGSASGTISFNYSQTSKKAIYIKSITVTYTPVGGVEKEPQTLSFSQTKCTALLDCSDFAEPVLSGAMTDVTYASSNTAVAEVDETTGEVAIVGEGTTKITATAEETDEYAEGSASYTITVSLPVLTEGYVALVAEKAGVCYAMTSELTGNRLLATTVNVVNGKVINNNVENIRWQINESKGTIHSEKGYVAHDSSSEITLSSSAYKWICSDGIWYTDSSKERWLGLGDGYFRAYAMQSYPAAVAMPFTEGYVRSGLTDGKYGTICLPCAVKSDDIRGMEVFSVVGKRVDSEGNPVSLVIAEEAAMEAGTPYVFKATAEEIAVAYTGEAVTAPVSANGLVGVFEDLKPVPGTGNYVISSNIIKKAGANTGVRANYAYIDMDNVPVYAEGSNAKRIFEIGNGAEPNSISSISSADSKVDVYSITGVRLRTGVRSAEATDGLGKGLYIVGGRKVVVR